MEAVYNNISHGMIHMQMMQNHQSAVSAQSRRKTGCVHSAVYVELQLAKLEERIRSMILHPAI
jgi:hypothetical protein